MLIRLGLDMGAAENGGAVEDAIETLVTDRVASRLFARDATLWGPKAEPEAAVRLGWTEFEEEAQHLIAVAGELRDELRFRGVDRVVLSGMGGSSLAPAVIAAWSGVELVVLDSTHPATVRRALSTDVGRTVLVVSSKSGSTVETLSHRTVAESIFRDAGIDPAQRVVVVTDPGSQLERSARAVGQRVVTSDPNVGGRFSALTAFGIVPTVLAGADVDTLVEDAARVRTQLAQDSVENPALKLAAALFSQLPERMILTLGVPAEAEWGLSSWIEQLIAESTGKNGTGMLPIALHPNAPELRDAARFTNAVPVRVGMPAPTDDSDNPMSDISIEGSLGAQFLLWQVATAVLGRLMGIDPFNQPDVESAKVAARSALESTDRGDVAGDQQGGPGANGYEGVTLLATSSAQTISRPRDIIAALREVTPNDGYLSIQAYLDPEADSAEKLTELRDRLASELARPVSLGWGPRYLHSVGQLHKGGPNVGAYLQVTEPRADDLCIPGTENGFGALIAAQARGDRDVLIARGRPVIALGCDDPRLAIEQLLAVI